MNILITGALGHLGSRLIRDLPETFPGCQITMLDNLLTQRYAALFNLKNSKAKYRFLETDILKDDIESLVSNSSVVIHLSALTEAGKSAHDPKLFEHVNFEMTSKIAQACAKAKVPLIFPSSCSVYSSKKDSVDENSSGEDLNAQSPYAAVKLKEEKCIQDLGKHSNLRFAICRLGTISGASMGMRFHTAVNSFCWNALTGKPISVWETALHQRRPYLALADLSLAFQHIIKNDVFTNEIYNVLNDNLTVNDIINYIKNEIPKADITFVKSDIMNSLSYDVDNTKFQKTGFEYRSSVKQSIQDTIELFSGIIA
jgi:UDP-glucose 4-epimerase